MALDVDPSLFEEIDDQEIRNILKRFSINGFATFKSDRVNHKISRAAAPMRDQKAIIMGPDRRTSFHFIAINDNIFDVDKLISSYWKDLIKELK
jgi:hypothetical protein